MNKAISGSKPKGKKDWSQCVRSRRHKVQNTVLGWALEYVQVLVYKSDEGGAWSRATRAQRRAAFAACFNEAPLYLAKRMSKQICRGVDIYQIYVPTANDWRRFIRMMFIDVCDKIYMMMVRPEKSQLSHKKHREQPWKTMTRGGEYRALRSGLGKHEDVVVYVEELQIKAGPNYFANEKVRNKIKKQEAGNSKGSRPHKRKADDVEEVSPAKKSKVGTKKRQDDSRINSDARAGMKALRCKH